MVEFTYVRLEIEGSLVRDSQKSLPCVFEQDTFYFCLVLVQSWKMENRLDMIEKLLTSM